MHKLLHKNQTAVVVVDRIFSLQHAALDHGELGLTLGPDFEVQVTTSIVPDANGGDTLQNAFVCG